MSFEPSLPPYNAGDPMATFVNATCLDLLLGELVPLSARLVHSTSFGELTGEAPAKTILGEAGLAERRRRHLDTLGYRVGQGLAERFAKDKPRFTDHLEVIKFLCKDLWTLVFRKQIDNLKTNHRGVYVLSDNSFYMFRRMSTKTPADSVVQAQVYLWFPSGILRGALASLGIEATVHAETSELPAATFQVKTVTSKST